MFEKGDLFMQPIYFLFIRNIWSSGIIDWEDYNPLLSLCQEVQNDYIYNDQTYH